MRDARITRDNSLLVIVDVQGKLALSMFDRAGLLANLKRLIVSAPDLDVPVVVLEQIPGKLGPTLPILEINKANVPVFEKRTFSAWGQPEFVNYLKTTKRNHLVVAGIESHVCVYQSIADFQQAGYVTHVVADAVSSRTEKNYRLGLDMCREAGAGTTVTESLLFEWMVSVDHPAFRTILQRVR